MEDRPAKSRTSPGEFMRQVQAEARKVVWPSREETVRTAIFVGIMMVILSLFFLGIDTVFGAVSRTNTEEVLGRDFERTDVKSLLVHWLWNPSAINGNELTKRFNK